jgi:gas vesicle protein
MNNQPINKKPNNTGFAFGVALGAVVGTAAMLLMEEEELKKFKSKLKGAADHTVHQLEEKYPEATHKIEEVINQAVDEIEAGGSQIRQLIETVPIEEKKKTPKKRFFFRNSQS